MSEYNDKSEGSGVIGWVDARLPILSFIKNHLTHYYTSKKISIFGIFLAL